MSGARRGRSGRSGRGGRGTARATRLGSSLASGVAALLVGCGIDAQTRPEPLPSGDLPSPYDGVSEPPTDETGSPTRKVD